MKYVFIIAILFMASLVYGQNKYAIVLSSYSPDTKYEEPTGWEIANPTKGQFTEFWNDTYLVWESLLKKGYQDSEIFVHYYEGTDFVDENSNYAYRYKAIKNGYLSITDNNARWQTLKDLFEGLANGINDYPKLSTDDFLVLYVLGHGGMSGLRLPPHEPQPGRSLLWTELETYLSNIDCHKKLIIMHQCYSGTCIPFLEDSNTIIMTAANDSLETFVCDSLYYDGIDFPGDTLPGNQYEAVELEKYDTVSTSPVYRHAEFNFHYFNAINGIDPPEAYDYYQTSFRNIPFNEADVNSDNYTSINEVYEWILDYDSQIRKKPNNNHWDDPQLSDSSNIASQTSLEYPTLLSTDIPAASNITHRGLIGISKDIHVPQGSQLTIHDNAVLHLVNEANLIVDQGATLIIGDNVTITGTNSNNELIVEGNITIGENVVFNSQNNVSRIFYFENPQESIILVANTIMGSDGRFVIGNEQQAFIFTHSVIFNKKNL